MGSQCQMPARGSDRSQSAHSIIDKGLLSRSWVPAGRTGCKASPPPTEGTCQVLRKVAGGGSVGLGLRPPPDAHFWQEGAMAQDPSTLESAHPVSSLSAASRACGTA